MAVATPLLRRLRRRVLSAIAGACSMAAISKCFRRSSLLVYDRHEYRHGHRHECEHRRHVTSMHTEMRMLWMLPRLLAHQAHHGEDSKEKECGGEEAEDGGHEQQQQAEL